MAAPLRIRITGIESTLASLNKNVDKIRTEIDNEMEASLQQMVTTSKALFPNAPVPKLNAEYGRIRGSIKSKKLKPFAYELSAGTKKDPMAAYIEFGTGRYFPQYPGKEKEWQDLAREFFVNGKGFMRPSPYIYPSVKSGLVSLLSNIKQIFARNERL